MSFIGHWFNRNGTSQSWDVVRVQQKVPTLYCAVGVGTKRGTGGLIIPLAALQLFLDLPPFCVPFISTTI